MTTPRITRRGSLAASRLALGILLALAAGCADIEPFEPVAVDEIPPGPGLLTGEDGKFVILRR